MMVKIKTATESETFKIMDDVVYVDGVPVGTCYRTIRPGDYIFTPNDGKSISCETYIEVARQALYHYIRSVLGKTIRTASYDRQETQVFYDIEIDRYSSCKK